MKGIILITKHLGSTREDNWYRPLTNPTIPNQSPKTNAYIRQGPKRHTVHTNLHAIRRAYYK